MRVAVVDVGSNTARVLVADVFRDGRVEAVQRGIGSGGLDSGVLLPESEQLIARFQALVLEALGN